MDIFDVNWLAVFLGGCAAFLFSGLYYGPLLGRKWKAESGADATSADARGADVTTDNQKSDNQTSDAVIYGSIFAFALLISWTIAHTYESYMRELSVIVKILTAFGVGIGFVLPAIGITYLMMRKSAALFFIDLGHWIIFFIIIGAVHAALG